MGGRIVVILVCMLMLTTVAGSLPSSDSVIKHKEIEREPSNMAFSHDILGEFFTLITCVPCKYSHRALIYLYENRTEWDLPFHYVTMVYDDDWGNKWAKARKSQLGVDASPTTCWDGPYIKDKGSKEDIEEDMDEFNVSLISCGNRNVKDIDLNLGVEWLGAVRNEPADGAILVPIEQILRWTNSQMEIDVEVVNNEANQYNGHLHVYVNEVNSTFWDDKWGDPYTHAFLDYAWNQDVTISASSSWDDTDIWDGYDHHTGYYEYYQNITQDNIIIVASVFDEDNNDYSDETTSVRTGIDTDPKFYDVYFGNNTPPPKIFDNVTFMLHDPELVFDETYYWQVDVWDQKGNFIQGNEWIFTTRGNDPPNEPDSEHPENGSSGISIKINLSWICLDPDGDDLTFNVFFGDHPEFNMQQIAENQTESWIIVDELEFLQTYYWYIEAWEVDYDLFTIGPLWHFKTEANVPPNQAVDPYPEDGDSAVPTDDLILRWNGSDDNYGDILKYDVYFDDVDPPLTLQAEGIYVNYFELPFNLQAYNEYYWQIDTTDREGEFTPGKVWSFYTGINHPPTCPTIDGPIKIKPDVEKDFTFVSTDQDNHSIRYVVDWDDGTPQFETGLFDNNTVVTLSHAWDNTGTYIIKARAYDEHGLPCNDWTEYEIVVTRSKAFNFNLLNELFTRFPKLFTIIRQLIET